MISITIAWNFKHVSACNHYTFIELLYIQLYIQVHIYNCTCTCIQVYTCTSTIVQLYIQV